MKLSLLEAANRVGMTKVGLYKAIKKGTISAEKGANGQWEIDPAELFRVYKDVTPVSAEKLVQVNDSNLIDNSGLQVKIDAKDEQIRFLKERLAAADDQNEKLLKMLNEQISTVRQLTDQREGQAVKKTGFWSRLFG